MPFSPRLTPACRSRRQGGASMPSTQRKAGEEDSLHGDGRDAGEEPAGSEQPEAGDHEKDEECLDPQRHGRAPATEGGFGAAEAGAAKIRHQRQRRAASADMASAATRSWGTRTSRSRAMMTPRRRWRPRRRRCRPGPTAASRYHAPVRGTSEGDDEAAEDPQLQRRTVLDVGEVDAAVIEHHHLVDHRELQVRVRIVHGDPRILREVHDEQRARSPGR